MLLAVLLLSLTACSQTSKNNDSTEQKPTEATQNTVKPAPTEAKAPETEAPTTEAPETEAPTTEAPETEAPTTEAPETEAPQEEEAAVRIGVIEGNTYTNETLGISCTVDNDWAFYNEEMMAALNQLTQDVINDDSVKEMLNNGASFMDAYGYSTTNNSNFNVTLQKVNALASLLTTEKNVLESAEEQTVSMLENAGFTDIDYSLGKATFAGKEHDVAYCNSKYQGMEIRQTIVCILKNGYCGSITITCISEEETEKILGFFSEID